jgi:formylglycine-generating enzyme required for sulfatase activity
LHVNAGRGDSIVLTAGNPEYRSKRFVFPEKQANINIWDYFASSTGKIVVQLFEKDQLIDERIVHPSFNILRLVSVMQKTEPAVSAPDGMVEIPAGTFRFYTKRDPNSLEPFIAFPDFSDTTEVQMSRFFMDKYPVTNRQFFDFLRKTRYIPSDTTGFMRHWVKGKIPEGLEDCPLVFVNRQDAEAYAAWVLKRLPTEMEWQYAAQGTDMRKYPWGNEMDSTKCNFNLNYPTPVSAFPEGASPFGVEDLIGNAWQMSGDVYFNGCYYYTIIRGGSYYHPTASIWYVTGGPMPVDHPEMLLLIGPGLDRNATVGFRLVKDATN